jgi:hypothetical protein
MKKIFLTIITGFIFSSPAFGESEIGRYQIIQVEYNKSFMSEKGSSNDLTKAVIKLDTSTGETWILNDSSASFLRKEGGIQAGFIKREWGKLEVNREITRDPNDASKVLIRDK